MCRDNCLKLGQIYELNDRSGIQDVGIAGSLSGIGFNSETSLGDNTWALGDCVVEFQVIFDRELNPYICCLFGGFFFDVWRFLLQLLDWMAPLVVWAPYRIFM
ncbi:hypothetical protein WICPIJ_000728 [Wickerhamomyces pijperi]|uniref:Uncharacterized protein n=1 Tax=Wickerhamomyces pijperi TaxID=599730 RepID=A0A9P8QFC6_WICPI|nr:hypothetical protein WICPIJ_000728 [Wickerhamomyces pijperi]